MVTRDDGEIGLPLNIGHISIFFIFLQKIQIPEISISPVAVTHLLITNMSARFYPHLFSSKTNIYIPQNIYLT